MSCCLYVFSAMQTKKKEEADLLDTVNYVKVQCSTYTHYNESSESKSLLRAIEGTRQVSKNIAVETENEKTLDDQLLKESAEQLWLTGIVVLDTDGTIVCEYSTNESLLPEIKECAEKEIVLDTAIYDEKVYAKRINHNDGAYIDYGCLHKKGCTGSCGDLLLYFCRVCNELYTYDTEFVEWLSEGPGWDNYRSR